MRPGHMSTTNQHLRERRCYGMRISFLFSNKFRTYSTSTPKDMYCTNEKCTEPMIMHQACFGQYEGRLVDELAKQGKLWMSDSVFFSPVGSLPSNVWSPFDLLSARSVTIFYLCCSARRQAVANHVCFPPKLLLQLFGTRPSNSRGYIGRVAHTMPD